MNQYYDDVGVETQNHHIIKAYTFKYYFYKNDPAIIKIRIDIDILI